MHWPFNPPKEISSLHWRLQEDVCLAARKRHRSDPYTRTRIILETVGIILVWSLVSSFLKPLGCPWVAAVLWALGAPFLLLGLCAAIERAHFRRACSPQLLFRGIRPSGCLMCGYNLKGSVSDHCPECGAALVMQGEAGPAHFPDQTDQAQSEALLREVKRGLIGALVGVVLCIVVLWIYESTVTGRYDAIRRQREREAAEGMPIGSSLADARAWFSGRGVRFVQSPYVSSRNGYETSGTVLLVTESLSPGGLLHDPATLDLTVYMDAGDEVKEVRCLLLEYFPLVAPAPATAKWRDTVRNVIILIPLLVFELWALWTLLRDKARSSALPYATTPPQ